MLGRGNEMTGRREVQEANLRFYETIAPVYDQIDSRRANDRFGWLDSLLKDLRAKCSAEEPVFADLGAGSGLLARHAVEHFPKVIAVDLSPAMLARIRHPRIETREGSCEALPLADASVHCAGLFATLHHLYEPAQAIREAARVLKPGGWLYSDHDIESTFVANFRWPLSVYRALFDHGKRYLAACPSASERDYEMSEFHGDRGVQVEPIQECLREFAEVRLSYHWEGLLPLTPPWRRRGISPLLRILARK